MGARKKVNIKVSEKGAKKTASSLKKVDKGIAGISRSAFASVAAMGGMFIGLAALKKGLDATIGASIRQEEIFRKLQTSIEISGTKYKDVSDDMNLMLRSIQDLTAFGDTETAEVFTTLIQLTGDYDTAVKALPVTLDLAASGLFDSATAARMMGQVMNGELTTLGRYFAEFKQGNPELAKLETAAEKAAFGLKILNEKVGGTAAKNINTVSGQWKQLKNELEDIGEALGDTALPKILELLKEFNEMLFGADKRARQLGEAYDFMNEHVGELTDSQLNALKAGQDMIDNYDDQKGAIEAFLLVFNIVRGDIDTMSSEALPALVEALGGAEEAFNSAFDTPSDGLGRLLSNMHEVRGGSKDDFKAMEGYAEQFGGTLSGVWADQLKEGKSFMDNIEEAFKNMLISMAAALAAKAVIFGILNFATGGSFGATRSLGKFLFGHEGGEVTPQGIKKFHSGGLASNEVPAILQRGEVVLSNSAVNSIGRENALSLNRTGQMSGGDTFHINIAMYGGNAEGIEDMVKSGSFTAAINTAIREGMIGVT